MFAKRDVILREALRCWVLSVAIQLDISAFASRGVFPGPAASASPELETQNVGPRPRAAVIICEKPTVQSVSYFDALRKLIPWLQLSKRTPHSSVLHDPGFSRPLLRLWTQDSEGFRQLCCGKKTTFAYDSALGRPFPRRPPRLRARKGLSLVPPPILP